MFSNSNRTGWGCYYCCFGNARQLIRGVGLPKAGVLVWLFALKFQQFFSRIDDFNRNVQISVS